MLCVCVMVQVSHPKQCVHAAELRECLSDRIRACVLMGLSKQLGFPLTQRFVNTTQLKVNIIVKRAVLISLDVLIKPNYQS